jgi:RNA polymerase sigma-70 factor (ECF subfamily)
MFRDATFTDVTRAGATHDDCAGFVIDEDTFRAFYERTARGVWAYLARVTGDRQLADDLLQETYYRFLRAAATHDNETHRRNSLYRIATNLARDARRRSLTHPFGLVGSEVERIPAGQQAGAAERVADFNLAMARLKPRERAMLWLAYAEGASHQEIAETLGVRAASLMILLFRARRKLADLLGRPPHPPTGHRKEAPDAAR